MQKLTIKDLINKALNFNLYSLRILKRSIVIIGSICLVIYLLVPEYENLDRANKEQKETAAKTRGLTNSQSDWDEKSRCLEETKAKNLKRGDFDHYIEFTVCFDNRGIPLSKSTMEYMNGFSDSPRFIENTLSSYYLIGNRPTRCEISGELMHCF